MATIFVSPEEAAALLRVSRSAMYELLRNGEIASVRHGKRRLVARASIERWAEEKLAAAGGAAYLPRKAERPAG